MNAQELIRDIRSYCKTHADPAIIQKYSRYFKEGYNAYGLPSGVFMAKVKELLASKSLTMDTVIEASRELIQSEKYEEPSFAMQLLKGFSKQFSRETFQVIEQWFPIGIRNWAHTDGLCSELLTPMLQNGIISMKDFAAWRKSKFPFQRRAVPVALIKFVKKSPDVQPYLDFLDPLMMDAERVVHQGLGWFLREAWKVHPQPVEAFLLKWKNDAARLIFQYATEKMAKEERVRFRRGT
ncbi:MAG: DNA alkylation repair protein [Bacteroidetes bacterium]|nr:MAG: DNA alkylation repair protein [Bacteroidota bacterium]